MKKINLKSKSKNFSVLLAIDDMDKRSGLSGISEMDDNEGMLFVWKEPSEPFMVMKGMDFDLDFIFLSNDNIVLEIKSADKDFKGKVYTKQKISAILELNKGNAQYFEIGEQIDISSPVSIKREKGVIMLEKGGQGLTTNKAEALMIGKVKYDNIIEGDIKIEKGTIQILNSDGEVIKNLKGGEYIFSRPDTKDLFNKAIRAKTKKEKEELGKLVLDLIDKQESGESLYVKN